jgi:hypothetical protein
VRVLLFMRKAQDAAPSTTDPDATDYLIRLAAVEGQMLESNLHYLYDNFYTTVKSISGLNPSNIRHAAMYAGAFTIEGAGVALYGTDGWNSTPLFTYGRTAGILGNGLISHLATLGDASVDYQRHALVLGNIGPIENYLYRANAVMYRTANRSIQFSRNDGGGNSRRLYFSGRPITSPFCSVFDSENPAVLRAAPATEAVQRHSASLSPKLIVNGQTFTYGNVDNPQPAGFPESSIVVDAARGVKFSAFYSGELSEASLLSFMGALDSLYDGIVAELP